MLIAEKFPGMGDPWDLTPAQWDSIIVRMSENIAMQSDNPDVKHAAHIRKLKRQKRWQKPSE